MTYKVATAKPKEQTRLRLVAKTCLDYGQRVQSSVFEMEVDLALWMFNTQYMVPGAPNAAAWIETHQPRRSPPSARASHIS